MLGRIASVISVTLITVTGLCGCRSLNAAAVVPFIPAQYFNCTETDVITFYNAYYSKYANISLASIQFDNQYYVFKDVKLVAEMLKTINDGYFWVSFGQIKCYLLHPSDMNHYKTGDKVDVVGLDIGIVMNEAGLVFKDCIVLPAGSVQLPAPGGGGASIPMY
jgi:hypothetical protein